MTVLAPIARPRRVGKAAMWLLVVGGLVLVVAANWRLVEVAVTSQPACVAHLRPGEGNAARGAFSAAESACSPPRSEPRASASGVKP